MKQGREWLLEQLPELERAGVLDAAAGERLRRHYQAQGEAPRSGWARILSAVLGAALIGLGVILLVAHNWDGWSRGMRLATAFTPLLLGQLACFLALLRAPADAGWREAAAVFTAAGFAAALALVGQIYHFPGDLDRFLLTCLLVSLPLVYLLNASLTAVLCAAAMAAWAAASDATPFMVVALFATLLPHVWQAWRQDAQSLRSVALASTLAPLFFVAMLAVLPHSWRLGWLWFAECAALLWLMDGRERGGVLRRPLQNYGRAGVAVAALAGALTEFWSHGNFWYRGDDSPAQAWWLLGAVLVGVLWLSLRALRARDWLGAAGAFPALMLWLALMVDSERYAVPLALLFNVYVLGLGIAIVRQGVAARQMARANSGLVLLAVLILMRFFDSDWPFTVRGVAFVLVGVGFLGANLWLKRRVQA